MALLLDGLTLLAGVQMNLTDSLITGSNIYRLRIGLLRLPVKQFLFLLLVEKTLS